MSDQTIFRRSKDRENPYVMIDRDVFQDQSLSWKAKGLMGYLLSRPDDWTVRMGDLAKRSPDGMASVRSGIKELEAAGYLTRQRIQVERGYFHWLIEVHEVPIQPSTIDPSIGFPSMDNPQVENRTLLSTDLTETDCTKKPTPETGDVSESEDFPTDSNFTGDPILETIVPQTDPDRIVDAMKRKERQAARSWTLPAEAGGADPWRGEPLVAFCKFAGIAALSGEGQIRTFAGKLRKLGETWQASPAEVARAIDIIPKTKFSWLSVGAPAGKGWDDAMNVIMPKILTGESADQAHSWSKSL